MVNKSFVLSVFEWRVEKFFFSGDVLSPSFALSRDPDVEKAQLLVRNVDGFLSVYVVFTTGYKNCVDCDHEHYLSINGQELIECTDEATVGDDHRPAFGIERVAEIRWLVEDDVFCPNGVLTLRHELFQYTSRVSAERVHSSAVSRLNVRSALQTLFIPVESVHQKRKSGDQTKKTELHFPLTDDRDVTIRAFSKGDDRLLFELLSTEGRSTVVMETSVKLVNDLDEGVQRETVVLTNNTLQEKPLPFVFSMDNSGVMHLEVKVAFHVEGEVTHAEHCQRDVEPVPFSKPEGWRRCTIYSGCNDVLFNVQGQLFSGNREALSIHSPVFERMFATDMTEGSSRLVHVKDAEPETVRHLLSFIHIGRLGEDAFRLPLIGELYCLADRYMVKALRQAIQHHLLSQLDDPGTALTGYRLSTVFEDDEGFRNRMEDFFCDVKNRRRVVNSDAFREFIRELPEEGCRIMYKIFRRKHLS